MKKFRNKTLSILIFISILIHHVNSLAQIPDNSTEKNSIRSFTANVCDDVWHVASSPFRISKADALQVSVLAMIATTFVAALDKPIDKEFINEGAEAAGDDGLLFAGKELAKIGYVYDDIPRKYFLAGLSGSMLAGGLIFKDEKLLKTSFLTIESYIITKAITSFGKGLFGRSRPYTGKSPYDFNFFKFSTKHKFLSMPSGHTSGIFSMMTVIAKQYDQWCIKIPAYTLSVAVALQRIDDHQHWASDVIVGGALGYWVGSTLVNKHKKKSSAISFYPYMSPNRIGLAINF